jgi:hypothetical protein
MDSVPHERRPRNHDDDRVRNSPRTGSITVPVARGSVGTDVTEPTSSQPIPSARRITGQCHHDCRDRKSKGPSRLCCQDPCHDRATRAGRHSRTMASRRCFRFSIHLDYGNFPCDPLSCSSAGRAIQRTLLLPALFRFHSRARAGPPPCRSNGRNGER